MLACVASCSSTSGGVNLGVVGRVTIDGPPEPRMIPMPDGSTASTLVPGFPTARVAYDGQTLVAWGVAGIRAELFLAMTGADIYPPATVNADTILVRDRKSKLDWRGTISTRHLPEPARMAFKPGEAELLGVTFFDPAMEQASPSDSGTPSTSIDPAPNPTP